MINEAKVSPYTFGFKLKPFSLFCNSSLNSRIEAATYSAQMELYISGKEADLSKWDTAIKDYENEKSKCKDVYPLVKQQ